MSAGMPCSRRGCRAHRQANDLVTFVLDYSHCVQLVQCTSEVISHTDLSNMRIDSLVWRWRCTTTISGLQAMTDRQLLESLPSWRQPSLPVAEMPLQRTPHKLPESHGRPSSSLLPDTC